MSDDDDLRRRLEADIARRFDGTVRVTVNHVIGPSGVRWWARVVVARPSGDLTASSDDSHTSRRRALLALAALFNAGADVTGEP